MIVCSYTLSDYRNSFYGAALAQGSVSLTGSTLIRRQHEVTCLEIVWCVWVVKMCAVVVRYTLTLDLCEQTALAIGLYNILLALLVCFALFFIRFTSVCCSEKYGQKCTKSGDLVTLVHHENVSWRPQTPQKSILWDFISPVASMYVSSSQHAVDFSHLKSRAFCAFKICLDMSI